MRELARATVDEVETRLGDVVGTRADWGPEAADYEDTFLVRFFLEEVAGQTEPVYHAMVQVHCHDGSMGLSEPIHYGHPNDLPIEWLDPTSIRFYFGVTIEELRAPGFWERFFCGDC
jgi:hypothetical protein